MNKAAKILSTIAAASLIGGVTYIANKNEPEVVGKQFTSLSHSFVNMVSADTLIIPAGSGGGYYFGQVNGIDSLHPFVVMNKDGMYNITSGGFEVENCKNFKIIGVGGSWGNYGFKTNAAGVPVVFRGKMENYEISHVWITGGTTGGLWNKTELSEVAARYNCDPKYLYPYHMKNGYFHDLLIENCGGEGFYGGSTNPLGGRDSIFCNGKWIKPRPMGLANMRIENVAVINSGRTGIQLSGADSGDNYIRFCKVYNSGRELNSSQGAGFAVGDGSINVTLYKDSVFKSYIYNFYSYGYGIQKLAYCYGDSAGYYGTVKNPQQIPSVNLTAKMFPTTYKIKNCTFKVNSAVPFTNYVVYNNNNSMTPKGNIFDSNTGTFQNNSGIEFKTANQ